MNLIFIFFSFLAAFGVQSTQSTGPFGGMSGQQPQQSIFGTASTQPLFGSSQPSIFGSTPNTGTTNTFGPQQTTSAFGGTSTSLFGNNPQSNTLFGGNRFGTNASSSPFGNPAIGSTVAVVSGTTIKFNPTAGTDTMMKNGVSTNINTRHQCITCMREYETKSLEELRLEDYTANRKGPQQSSGMFGSTGTQSSSNLFGATSAQPNAFSSTSNTGLFGQNKPSFGSMAPTTSTASSSGLFGSFNQNQNQKSFFASNTSFPSAQTPAPTTSMFGSVSTANPTLNNSFFSGTTNTTATVKPLFGGTTAQPQQPLFGQTSTQNTSLGQKPLFGTTSTSVPQFGTNTTTLFNSNPNTNLFSSSQPSLFNTGNTSTNSLTKPLFTFNNTSTLPLNSSIGGSGVTSTSSLFGNTSSLPAFGNTGSLFGTNQTNFNFGSTNPSFQSNNAFQPNVSLQAMSGTSQGVSNEQLVTRFQTFPYGDSPQLQIDVTVPSNAKMSTKFTTDPKTLNQYKISAKTIDNRPQRFVNNSSKINTMLFDGLEEDNSSENKSAKDIFVRRRNIKKLVFKPKNNSSMSDLNGSQNSSNNSSSFMIKTQQNISGNQFNDSIASNMTSNTINEFIRKDNTFVKQMETNPKSRLTISPSEKRDLEISSEDISLAGEQISESEHYMTALPKCGVILTRSDYYTFPPLEELDNYYDPSTDTCIVPNFTVGRHDYGSIYWDQPIDVKGLNLDQIVHIRRKEVIVYPDEDMAPKVGEGLNRSAQITLDQVWPIDKTTHEIIKDKERLRTMRYTEKVEASTAKLGATFKEYRPDSGSWVFTVKHFSKYGLLEDDDEEEDIPQKAIQKTTPKQTDLKQVIDNKKKLFSEQIEERDIDYNSVLKDLSSNAFDKNVENRDIPLQYLFDEEDEEMYGNGADQSLKLSLQLSTEYSDISKMRSLFDDYEEGVSKKTKTYPIISSQRESKGKLFSPILPSIGRPIVSKRRELSFNADVFAAENKLISDISSVCLSNSPKLQFFNGSRNFIFTKGSTVLICELNLFEFNASVVDRFDKQFKENSNLIQSCDETTVPFVETKEFAKNSYNCLSLELLVETLFGPLTEVTPYTCHQQKIDRILNWLFSANKKLLIPKKSFSKIIHYLSANQLESAVEEALNYQNPRLASLLSFGSSINKDLIISQLDSWKRSKADLFIEYDLIKIYVLMSGLIEWKLSNQTVVKVLEDLNWTQQLALILLYKTPPEVDSNELGLNLLSTSISCLTVKPEEVEYHLLSSSNPWISMCWSPSALDAWFLHESLRAYHVMLDDNDSSTYLSDYIHSLIASQIPDIGWACFVATHIKNDAIRQMIVKEIISRNGRLLKENIDLKEWLLNELHIPSKYLSEALAIESKATFDYTSLAMNLIECKQWGEAHDILMEWVLPQMIINEQNQSIEELIGKLKPNSHLITNWYSNGAHIYETYLKCLKGSNIEDIKAFNIHQLKCYTKRHVLCQSEMTRKVNIIFSELSGGQFAYNTPIPDDYALIELKVNAKNLIKSLA